MLNRRSFLQTTALMLTMPAGRQLFGAVLPPNHISIRVVASSHCADTEAFFRDFDTPKDRIGADIGEYLQSIKASLEQEEIDMLFGLTRDSDHTLLGQVALEHGYRIIYSGRHHYGDAALTHSFAAGPNVIGPLLGSFRHGDHGQWSRTLARCATLIAHSSGSDATGEITLPNLPPPPGSPGHLVSWAFARG